MSFVPDNPKDPDAVIDYQIDWTAWLNGDVISTSTWAADTGITVDSDSDDGSISTVWLSGGTAGTTYSVTNQIITTAGRTDDRSLSISVAER